MSSAAIYFNTVSGPVYAINRNAELIAKPQIRTEVSSNIPGTGESIAIMGSDEASNRTCRVRVRLAP